MKQKLVFVCMLLLFGVFSVPAGANYTFQPSDADLADLDHWNFYIWKVDASEIDDTETIDSASLSFDNINDWRVEPDDIMYVHLLSKEDIDNAVADLGMSYFEPDINRGGDNPIMGNDAFDGYGYLLMTYIDDDPQPNPAEDFVYQFDESELDLLRGYIEDDGMFGLGFDPDCHYYNDGITLTIGTTTSVPAPGAVLLGSLGLGLVGWLHRRKTL